MGADEPHFRFVYWILEQTRENSIASASADIKVPALKRDGMLKNGAINYAHMCANCHLVPGQKNSDISLGLYPTPPGLASIEHNGSHREQSELETARQWFWTIKHGIKASGMPAWGKTHNDAEIWEMVSFLKELPNLTLEQYNQLTKTETKETELH